MIEQYIYNMITGDDTLAELLAIGSDDYHLYPNVIPRGIEFDKAVTFTLITTNDAYPAINSVSVQFNIFAKTHSATAQIAKALSDLFNGDNHQSSGGVDVIYSQRQSESDLGFNFDENENMYQREATYYFKIR